MGFFKKLLGYPAEDKKVEIFSTKKDVAFKRDLIEFIKLTSDKQVIELADRLLAGYPLVVNVEDLSIDEANQAIAFLSGIIYAEEGTNLKLKQKVFLFTLDENLKDGSIMEFYEEYKEG